MADRTPLVMRAILLLGFVLLICCGSSAVWLNREQRTAENWVRHTFAVGAQLDRVEMNMLAIDIDRRDAALFGPGVRTGDFGSDRERLTTAIERLARLTRDNPHQQLRIDQLRREVGDALGDRTSAPAAELMTADMRQVMIELRRAEARLLQVRRDRSGRIEALAGTILFASLALAILLAAVAFLDRRRRLLMLAEANAPLKQDNLKLEQAEGISRAALAKLSEGNRLLLMTEAVAQVGHWRLDVLGNALFWSDSVCCIHGMPAGYVPQLDSAIEAYHPDDRALVAALVERALTEGIDFDLKGRIMRGDGTLRHVVTKGRVERSATGEIIALFGVLQDVTTAVTAEAALLDASRRIAESNRLLTMAEAMGKLGHWRLAQGGAMVWSDEVLNIFGFAAGTEPTIEAALSTYDPDDADRARATVREALATGTGYTAQSRIVRPDGSTGHIVTRAEIERDADGHPSGLFGIVQDVTEQVLAEVQRQAQDEQYRLITEEASDLIVISDEQGLFLFVSPSARSVLGYRPDEMIGTTPYDYAPKEDRHLIDRQWAALRHASAGEVIPLQFRMRRKDGGYIWVDVASRIAAYRDAPRVVTVCRDVTDQVTAEHELRQAREQAEAAARAKASFLANMSHEIRTPMNGVIGFTELLGESALQPEQRRQVELIADSGRAMMRLLNDILDLSKVEAGQMKIAHEPFDVAHTLKACLKLVAPALAKKGLRCDCDISAELPALVIGDGLRLRQIVLNLLGNAIKFTERGGVTLRAWPDGDGQLVIEVEDTGIGVEPGRQEAIFEQFVQADSGIVSRFGGTGLGLAISAQLARLMGGTVGLESVPGEGSRFYLTVPLDTATERLAGAEAAEAMAVPAAGNIDMPPVLVAEDHDVNQMLTAAMLRQLGYRCDIAEDGGRAVAMVRDAIAGGRPYGIVLMDMQMPVMGGIDAARSIRAGGIAADHLPIVALTANAYADDVAACLEAGMQAHLTKPLRLADLRAALTRWIAQPAASAATTPVLSAKIRERYGLRRDEALRAVAALVRSGRFDADIDLSNLAETLHKLAGTAAMFGDAELGDRARDLELGLRSWAGVERERALPPALAALMAAA